MALSNEVIASFPTLSSLPLAVVGVTGQAVFLHTGLATLLHTTQSVEEFS